MGTKPNLTGPPSPVSVRLSLPLGDPVAHVSTTGKVELARVLGPPSAVSEHFLVLQRCPQTSFPERDEGLKSSSDQTQTLKE